MDDLDDLVQELELARTSTALLRSPAALDDAEDADGELETRDDDGGGTDTDTLHERAGGTPAPSGADDGSDDGLQVSVSGRVSHASSEDLHATVDGTCPICKQGFTGTDGGRAPVVLPCLHQICKSCARAPGAGAKCEVLMERNVKCGVAFDFARVILPDDDDGSGSARSGRRTGGGGGGSGGGPDGRPIKCATHPAADVAFFCDRCLVLTCKDCIVGRHRGHDMLSFDEARAKAPAAAAARAAALGSRLNDVEAGIASYAQLSEILQDRLEANVELVDEKFNEIITELREKTQQLEMRRYQLREDVRKSIQGDIEQVKAQRQDLVRLRDHILTTTQMSEGGIGSSLVRASAVAQRVSELEVAPVPSEVAAIETVTFMFAVPLNVLVEDINTLGSVLHERVSAGSGMGARGGDDDDDDDDAGGARGRGTGRLSPNATLVSSSQRRGRRGKGSVPRVGTIGRSGVGNVGSVGKYMSFSTPANVIGGPEPGTEPLQFTSPIGVTVLPNGIVVVSEWTNERLQMLTMDGAHLRFVKTKACAAGVSSTKAGEIWVALRDVSRVRLLTPVGVVLREIKCPLASIAVQLDNGDVAVGCGGANLVKLFAPDGREKWSSGGDGFKYVYSLVAANNELVVCDNKNNRLQVLSLADGRYLRSIGRDQLNGPCGVAYDPFARVLIVSERDRISVWTQQGAVAHRWGTAGTEPGQFSNGFGGCCIAPNGSICAVDWGNHRLQIFS